MKTIIKAFSNNDDAVVAWRYEKRIPDCYGFALFRKLSSESDATAEPVLNSLGFESQNPKDGERTPSTEWPIQKFFWTDYGVNKGEKVSYMVVPMLMKNGKLVKDTANATKWSNVVSIDTGTTFKANFNRGIISSQFVARGIQPGKKLEKNVKDELQNENSKLRAFLGGNLSEAIYKLLDDVIADKSLSIYCSLFELNEPGLITRLLKLKKRANVILANGAFKSGKPDENKDVRKKLKAAINIYDRIVKGGHFAHNKFMVVCKKSGSKGLPQRVLTGSTNWTTNGFFAQINNGLIIENKDVAAYYLEEWNRIKKAGNLYPADFKTANSTEFKCTKINTETWFAPVNKLVDLNEASGIINNAKEGILFLFFNPGTKGTLLNAILDKKKKSPKLFVHGIANQDPGGKKNPLIFFNRGKKQPTEFPAIIPRNFKGQTKFFTAEPPGEMVRIHSKVVLIDPFTDNPTLITGSHNLGPKASRANDDNLNIIMKDNRLAEEYAVHIMSVYTHYRSRYLASLNNDDTKGWKGLIETDKWQDSYFSGEKKNELDFWLT